MRCTQAIEAGAYVLGALSPAERSTYQRHMATCAECRNEVADLAGLPGLLGRLDEATAAGLTGSTALATEAPPAVLSDAVGRVVGERARARRRSRWRTAILAVAAACVALAAGLGVPAIYDKPMAPPLPNGVVLASMKAVEENERVVAVIGFRPAGGGTDIYMSCLYAETGSRMWHFQLWVYPRYGGSPVIATRWDASPGQNLSIFGHSDLAPNEIDRIEVQLVNGARLLTYKVT